MPSLEVALGDITAFDVGAVVNAANPGLSGGGGVDGAIHRAGGPAILEECLRIVERSGTLATGDAVATTGGRLKARHVIHTVGPVWGRHPETEAVSLLSSCYRRSLEVAIELSAGSIAFPNISTGIYGFPKDHAAEIAVETVASWQDDRGEIDVVFVCFEPENFSLYRALLPDS